MTEANSRRKRMPRLGRSITGATRHYVIYTVIANISNYAICATAHFARWTFPYLMLAPSKIQDDYGVKRQGLKRVLVFGVDA